jgi:GMP synthase-like glutamine amidotransferase
VKILAVTHGPDAGPELFGDVAREHGHEVVEWPIERRGVPDVAADAVMVFGGAQNVGEEEQHPWLHDEYEALRGWVAGGTPLLGICLGAQTLAHAAGARVEKAPAAYGGFLDTQLTPEGAADPVLGVLPERFDALNGNAYRFELAPGAVELARAGSLRQAFRLGDRAWGLQFHPEVRRDQVVAWYRKEGGLGRAVDELVRELDAGIEHWQALGRRLARAFLAVAED